MKPRLTHILTDQPIKLVPVPLRLDSAEWNPAALMEQAELYRFLAGRVRVQDGNPAALQLQERLEQTARLYDLLAAGARVFAPEQLRGSSGDG